MTSGPFAKFAQVYRELGCWPRPIKPGTRPLLSRAGKTPTSTSGPRS